MTLRDRRFVSLLTFVLSHSLPNSEETRDHLMISLSDNLKAEGLWSTLIPVKYSRRKYRLLIFCFAENYALDTKIEKSGNLLTTVFNLLHKIVPTA